MKVPSLDWNDPDLDSLLRVSGEFSAVVIDLEKSIINVGVAMLNDLLDKATVDVVDKTGIAEGPVREWLTDFAYKLGDINLSAVKMVENHSLDTSAASHVVGSIYSYHYDRVNT
ncbi:hypothetical protein [Pseudomonas aeruginosa]|uniref:Uncharacterized protein n=1 Tax=Pseudomonas phage vB_PaeM_PS119XW TaxID=2601632 RepID=A0A5C1K960_9CAUD|nr:hypothetical protein [Pseudomonas aeruginosa]YP_010661052.1 hypothetical protein PP933_gp312 [Pseudomonas phage vB_PaeM_PS119XW]QBX32469.1 hypothetical protein [Pseudomonas phage PA1C]BEG72556.1 hypothetical protein RVBP21_1840 [Pseudomonas phage BRkr]MBW6072539.1 hypothetical protein [Pseudomonas aeruginosa]QEM42041.1 hypothetical protein [Pseudomonas phage vB_PaeM_PS119XW]